MDIGKRFLSELKLYSDYLKWDEKKQRYETWKEACDKVLETHTLKYGEKINSLLEEIKPLYYNKDFLVSQRNLQFRGQSILRHNTKLYNCGVSYCNAPDVFSKGMYVLLSGVGLGISMRKEYVSMLPHLHKRDSETKLFIIPDSIEGWAEAIKVLISSYCSHISLYDNYFKCPIKFDYSLIRPKGAEISGGFKAPGPDGLKQSIEKIEALLNSYLREEEHLPFKSILAYDIFMHISDAVLSGGVRRSAMNLIIDEDDEELINAKTGDWWETNKQRARSNNSVGLIRNEFTKAKFKELVNLNEGNSDLGFVFSPSRSSIYNPCFEISFDFWEQIQDKNFAVFQFCNLDEINASACYDKKGKFSKEKFLKLCRAAAIIGTFQAGFTDFPYLGEETERIVRGEALLGVSITGWMTCPELFDEELLKEGARLVKEVNREVAQLIGINPSARTTTVKPSGNASVILQTASGIHPEHSERYFRIMQLNKDSETAKYLEKHQPFLLENSLWSNNNTDYVVYSPCINNKNTFYKKDMQGIKHLELIKLVQNSWVKEGKTEELCYVPTTDHNVSNTVIMDNKKDIIDYLYKEQDNFAAVSFMTFKGDKDYCQAPMTSVLNTEELINEYGEGMIFISGLIVDGLHYFNNNLWEATDYVLNNNLKLTGTREQVLLKKDWIRRVKKYSKNYFNNNLKTTVYCMKDTHLWHKWKEITRSIELINYSSILTKPNYVDVDTLGAVSCHGGSCDII